MFYYYLCDDYDTIYQMKLSLKEEEKNYYLSLLENYLTELIFVEESKLKKIVEKDNLKEENEDNISIEDYQISINRTSIVNVEKIEDYLPFVVTVKTKKYFFLRSCTISMLIRLLSKEIEKIDNTHIIKIVNLLDNINYIDFSLINKIFLDESGSIIDGRFYDYNSLISLLKNLEVEITEKYSKKVLSNLCAIDDAERSIADSIIYGATSNKESEKKLKLQLFKK